MAILEFCSNSFKTKSKFLLHTKGVVSSKKLQTLQSRKKNKSFKLMLNNNGIRTDPCSMPWSASSIQEPNDVLILVLCQNDLINNLIALRILYQIHRAWSFTIKYSWFRVSSFSKIGVISANLRFSGNLIIPYLLKHRAADVRCFFKNFSWDDIWRNSFLMIEVYGEADN